MKKNNPRYQSTYNYIQVIRQCNQNCLFCSNPANGKIISFEKIKSLLINYKKDNARGVIWTGGEPTLYPDLSKAIKYAKKLGLENKLITNGYKTIQRKYLSNLIKSGLNCVHFSIYSHKADLQAYLSQNKNSLQNIITSLDVARDMPIMVSVNLVINKYNSKHFDKTTYILLKKFPYIRHFVINNLDPMHVKKENLHTVPVLREFEKTLISAVKLIKNSGKTVRVERVPLCYMPGFEHLSTETRAIVKKESKILFFLDKRGLRSRNKFTYIKSSACKQCSLSGICGGLFQGNKYYAQKDLKAQKKDPQKIISKILELK